MDSDLYRRARTPDALSNGGPRSPLRSQDPPHSEPIWPSRESVSDPFDSPSRFQYPSDPRQYPELGSQYPDNRSQYPDNREPYPDSRNQYPDSRNQYPDKDPYPDSRNQYPDKDPYPDRDQHPTMWTQYPDNRYDNRYINPPDPRMQRARTPDILDDNRRNIGPPDPYRRSMTPDALDNDRRHPPPGYRRSQTPDKLDDRRPDQRARRAATPDQLDGRPPRYPPQHGPQDQYRRARTPDHLDERPQTLDGRYRRARTPDHLDEPPTPRYYTMDNRQPLSPRSPEAYQRARTPDALDGYPRSPGMPMPYPDYNGDAKPYVRQPSYTDQPDRLRRAPSYDPYMDIDPYGHSRSSDNLDDVWGKMMTGNQDYENYIPDLVMTPCKRDQTLTVRVDRVTRDQVDLGRAHHVGDGPFKDIIINKSIRKLPEVEEPEIKMKFLVHMKDKRRYDGAKEVRELRYWFKPYTDDDAQTDNAKEYFKTLLQPEAFPRDYVGFLKKALVLTRHFPMVARLEIAMYPAPPDADKRASFIDTQEEQVVVTPMQPLLGPATYDSGGGRHGGGPGGPGSGGLAFRDSHGPDLFAKVRQGDGREYYKDAGVDDEDEIDYDQIVENFITVLTPTIYDYQYLPEVPVSDKRHIVFQVKAKADAHLALSSVYGDTDRKTYEVVIGGWNNKKSCIRYGGQGDIVEEATTFNILSGEELRRFWISWDRGLVQVGEGRRKGVDTFLRWQIPDKKTFSINCLAVSTGPDSNGEWEFVELIRPKTEEGLKFNFLTEKTPSHTMVTRVRKAVPRQRTEQPRRAVDPGGRPPHSTDANRKSHIPAYSTLPRGVKPPYDATDGTSDGIKSYPRMERSRPNTPKARRSDRFDRPMSVAYLPTLDRTDKPKRPISQGDVLDKYPDRPSSRSDVIDYMDRPSAERLSYTGPTGEDFRAYPKMERPSSRSGSLSKPQDDNPPGYRDQSGGRGDARKPPVAAAKPMATRSSPSRQIPVKIGSSPPGTSLGKPPIAGSLRRNEPRKLTDDPSYATVKKRDDRPPSHSHRPRAEMRTSPDRGKPPSGSNIPKPKPTTELPRYKPSQPDNKGSRDAPISRIPTTSPKGQTLPSRAPQATTTPKQSGTPQKLDEIKYRSKPAQSKDKKSRPRSEIVMTLVKSPASPKYVPANPKYVPSSVDAFVENEENEEMKMADPRYTPRLSYAYKSLPGRSRQNPRASWAPASTGSSLQPPRRSYSPGPPANRSSHPSAFRSVGTPRRLGTVR